MSVDIFGGAPLELEPDELAIDLFAGAGGASKGVEAAIRRPLDIALNHDAVALAVHKANHPETLHLEADIREAKPARIVAGRRVGMIWASPDCTDHSIAKGGMPRRQDLRVLAFQVVRWVAATKTRLLFLESVREFEQWGPLDKHGKPIKARRGEMFRRFVGRLRDLGYQVDWRVLDASSYGAPTRRKRLFLIARRDGHPIVWPEPTHGPGLAPLHTAAECIDWDLPCRSIFGRKKPLAEKTLWRIAQGIRRFVLETPSPFILKVNHGKREPRASGLGEPLSTITAHQRGHALVAPTLVQTGYGERPGQRPRYLDLHQPLGTLVNGQKHALVAAFLNRHYGGERNMTPNGVVGDAVDKPIATITATDHHSLTATHLVKLRGQCTGASLDEPMPTLTAKGTHVAEVRAFLTAYYGSDGTTGQQLLEPMRTITARHRLGLVMVANDLYQIVDIGLRMLEPHELKRAQFGRFAEGYDLSAATTKKDQVRLIGNSVPPEVVEQIVAANVRPRWRAAA